MTCSQRCNFFLLYCLLAMVHVRQTVNSLQDESSRYPRIHHHYRHNSLRVDVDSSGGDEHHRNHHHQHYQHHQRHQHHNKQQLQYHEGAGANPIKTNKMHLQHQKYMHARRRIEEAVHAFNSPSKMRATETTSMAPLRSHHSPGHRIDNRQPHKKPLPWIVNHRSPAVTNNFHFTTAMPSPTSSSTTRTTTSSPPTMHSLASGAHGRGRVPPGHQQRSLPSAKHSGTVANSDEDDDQPEDDDDEDYYYYGDDDDDNENADEDADAYGNSNDEGESEYNGRYLLTNSETSPSPFRDDAMDYDDNFLADEPSEGGGSLTEQKLRNYSTPENVARMRASHLPSEAVRSHIDRIRNEMACKYPRPRVVPAPSEASTKYVPHCTVLHRCGSDTGCCDSSKICVPKSNVTVVLDFFVIKMGIHEGVKKLQMENHTECHCVSRLRIIRTTLAPDTTTRRPVRETNQCVKDFVLITDGQDYTRCDCVTRSGEQKENCEPRKKGEEGFALDDQRCVAQGRCKPPTCEYGEYNKTAGRCPGKSL